MGIDSFNIISKNNSLIEILKGSLCRSHSLSYIIIKKKFSAFQLN